MDFNERVENERKVSKAPTICESNKGGKVKKILLAGLLAFLMTGVGFAQDEVGGTLSIVGFGLGDEIASVRVDQFREQYPEVELNLSEGSLDRQQLLTAVVSGNPPDLIYTNRDDLSTYATRGAIVPLDECTEAQGIDLRQYRETALAQVTVNDQVYGIPEFFNTIVLVLNVGALDEVGLSVEEVSTSDWESLAEVNERLTEVESGTLERIGFDPKIPEFFPLWVRANGGRLLSDDGRTATIDSPEAVEALEFTARLHEAAGGRQDFSAFRDTWDFFGSQNQLVTDQLGAFPVEQWYVNVLADVSPDVNIAVKPFTDRQGDPITFATGNTWAIPRGAENPEAACAFMRVMTEPASWAAAARVRADQRAADGQTFTGVYTASRPADEQIFGEIYQPSGNAAFDEAVDVILRTQDSAFSIPANPAGAEFRQAWQDAVNRVLNGEQSAQEALEQAQREAQAALDEAWNQ